MGSFTSAASLFITALIVCMSFASGNKTQEVITYSTEMTIKNASNISTLSAVNFVLQHFNILGQVISIACLVTTFVLYVTIPVLRTPQGYCIANMVASQAVQQLVFLLGSDLIHIPILCKIIASLNHYFWLASFFWMISIAINSWWALTNYGGGQRLLQKRIHYVAFTMFSWGTPLMFVGIYLALHPTAEGMTLCFMTDPHNLLLYLVAPCATLVAGSLMVYFHYMFLSCKSENVNPHRRRVQPLSDKMRIWKSQADTFYLMQIIVFLVMGTNVITEYARIVVGNDTAAAISLLATMSQGIVMNIIYACKKTIYIYVYKSMKQCVIRIKTSAKNRRQKPIVTTNVRTKMVDPELDPQEKNGTDEQTKYDDQRMANYRKNHSLNRAASADPIFRNCKKGGRTRLEYVMETMRNEKAKSLCSDKSSFYESRTSSFDSEPLNQPCSSSQSTCSNDQKKCPVMIVIDEPIEEVIDTEEVRSPLLEVSRV